MINIGKDLEGNIDSVDGFDCTVRLWKRSDSFWFMEILDEEGNDVIVNFFGAQSVGVRPIRQPEQRNDADSGIPAAVPDPRPVPPKSELYP